MMTYRDFLQQMMMCSDTLATVEGIPPLSLPKSKGKALKDYRVYGQSVQNGTPTPSNPIEVESVGDLVTSGEYQGQYRIPLAISNNPEFTNPQVTNIYLNAPLRKIGNYADYIDFKGQKVVRNTGEWVINGTETYGSYDEAQHLWLVSKPQNVPSATGRNTLLCNMYGICSTTSSSQLLDKQIVWRGTFAQMFVKDESFASAAELKTFAESQYALGEPIKISFILATPTEESITLPSVPTIKGQCYFKVLTDVTPSNSQVKYLK